MIGFPLLLIPFAIYNMIAFLTPGVSWSGPSLLIPVPLKSGVDWTPTCGDAFLAFSLLMLMFEFIKSTRHGRSFVEHFLALLLAGGAAAEFVMVHEVGNFDVLHAVRRDLLRRSVRGLCGVAAPRAARGRGGEPAAGCRSLAAPSAAGGPRRARRGSSRASVHPRRACAARAVPRAEPAVKIEPVQKVRLVS